MATYFIADTHFDDENILKYYHRPFKDVNEMNETIYNNIVEKLVAGQSSVSNPHKLFMLGDIGNTNFVYDILNNCKCGAENGFFVDIMIVKGNHDNYYDFYDLIHDYNVSVSDYPIMVGGCWLSHEPITYMPPECPYLNIHGHTHSLRYGNGGTWADGNRYYNVSVENTNYYPVSMDRIRKELFIS